MKVLVTGGTGSGKSRFALNFAERMAEKLRPKNKIFIATAEPKDEEMRMKIDKHKREREHLNWHTIEEPYDICEHLENSHELVLIDCLTMWMTNVFFRYRKEPRKIENEKERLLLGIRNFKNNIIIVTNEIGLGIIPENEDTREWMKHLSELNGRVAEVSDEVFFMISGIPLKVK